jgi:hypothetical protein
MSVYYDRYGKFRENANMKPVIGVKIPESTSDKKVVYKQGLSRLDKMSNMYYLNPYSGWLIMLANPQFGGLEFNIPDLTQIRIPYPLEDAMQRYITEINNHILLYGE